MSSQRPPKGLGAPGRRLWRSMTDRYEFDGVSELWVLEALARAEDRLDELRALLAAEGLTTTGSKGQAVVHPLATEERRLRDQSARLLRQLDLPTPDQENVTSMAAHRLGRLGAQRRWRGRKGA